MPSFLDRKDEKDPSIAMPGPYSDPNNPDANGYRLVTLDHEHHVVAAQHLSPDYGDSPHLAYDGDVAEGLRTPGDNSISEDDIRNMTVVQLDTLAEEWELEDYPKSANKDDKTQYLIDNAKRD